MEKKCRYCGKPFKIRYSAEVYCSEECRKKGTKAKSREYAKYYGEIRKVKKKKASVIGRRSTIVEIARAASEVGLSYGYFVAWNGL
jgi:hypothetical protein